MVHAWWLDGLLACQLASFPAFQLAVLFRSDPGTICWLDAKLALQICAGLVVVVVVIVSLGQQIFILKLQPSCRPSGLRVFMQDLLLFKRRIMCPAWCCCYSCSSCYCSCSCSSSFAVVGRQTHTNSNTNTLTHLTTCSSACLSASSFVCPTISTHTLCNILFTFFTRRLPYHILLLNPFCARLLFTFTTPAALASAFACCCCCCCWCLCQRHSFVIVVTLCVCVCEKFSFFGHFPWVVRVGEGHHVVVVVVVVVPFVVVVVVVTAEVVAVYS